MSEEDTSPSKKWSVVLTTRRIPQDTLEITSPKGFEFSIDTSGQLANLMAALTGRGIEVRVNGSTRFIIDDGGNVTLLDFDPWDNSGFGIHDSIGHSHDLGTALASYLAIKLALAGGSSSYDR